MRFLSKSIPKLAHGDGLDDTPEEREHAATLEVAVREGSAFAGVVAARTGKAWLGRAEAPMQDGTQPAEQLDAEAQRAVSDARAKLVDDVASSDDSLTEKYLDEGTLTQTELDE